MNKKLQILTLALFALGIAFGALLPKAAVQIAFIGDIYVKLLKLVVVPLLMTQIAAGVAKATQSFAKRLIRVIALFVVMFVVSFCITAVAVSLLKPGAGADLPVESWNGELAAVSVSGFFSSIIPDNIIASMSGNAILPCILFAFVFGIASAKTHAEAVIKLMDELSGVFTRFLDYIMVLTPAGVFALMANCTAGYGTKLLGVCAKYILIAWALSALVTLIVMILPVWLYAHISPVTYVKRVCRLWLVTLSTCSSAAALPHTIRVCNESFGIPEEITSIVVPLGCTIHMCGGAVSFCLLGLFTFQMAGIPLTAGMFIYMLLIATLMNMAAPGIPGGGIVLGATYLTILGAPIDFIGLYSGIYRLLDMPYTTLNVTGDITANILLSEYEKKH